MTSAASSTAAEHAIGRQVRLYALDALWPSDTGESRAGRGLRWGSSPVTGFGEDFVNEPTTMPWGNRSLLFRDPDGNLVNFFTPVTPAAVEKFARRYPPQPAGGLMQPTP